MPHCVRYRGALCKTLSASELRPGAIRWRIFGESATQVSATQKESSDEAHSPYPSPLGLLARVRRCLREGRRDGKDEPRRAPGAARAVAGRADDRRWVRI